MIDLEDLRAFVEVVESGGFNRGAQRLGVSKSIVSRRIGRLEAELGARLLSRTTRGISPTEAGLELKARSERILAELEEAREAVAHRGGDVVGRLRVSAPLSSVTYLGPIFGEMARRYPQLELDISFSDRIVDLAGERFDAAIRIGTLRDPNLIARRLAPVRSVVAASPDYIEKHGAPQTPDDLQRHESLIYTGAAAPEIRFQRGKASWAVRPEGRLRSDNGDALVNWALHGLGVLVVPYFLAAAHIASGKLVQLLAEFEMPEFAVYVVRPPGAYLPGKVRALIDTLVEHFDRPHFPGACTGHPVGVVPDQSPGSPASP